MAENPGSAHESVGDQIFNFIAFAADALIYPFSVAGAVHLVGRAAYAHEYHKSHHHCYIDTSGYMIQLLKVTFWIIVDSRVCRR